LYRWARCLQRPPAIPLSVRSLGVAGAAAAPPISRLAVDVEAVLTLRLKLATEVGQAEETIAFTAAYAEIEATYLVPAGSPLKTIADFDAAGVRIAVTGRTAYGLWLDRNIKHAELVRSETLDSAYEQFVRGNLEALAGLRPRLLSDLDKLPGARIIDGRFTSVQQAIGTAKKNTAGAAFLRNFVEEAKASRFVARLIERHKVRGLSVAPPA
jgi:polar amino acid transport system substrate-binding protein